MGLAAWRIAQSRSAASAETPLSTDRANGRSGGASLLDGLGQGFVVAALQLHQQHRVGIGANEACLGECG